MPRGMQRGNREVKKPKKEKPKDKSAAGYKSDTAMLMGASSKPTGGAKKNQK